MKLIDIESVIFIINKRNSCQDVGVQYFEPVVVAVGVQYLEPVYFL